MIFKTLKKERKFEEKLNKSKGWIIKRMKEDGACLFRAVGAFVYFFYHVKHDFQIIFCSQADQVYGDQEMHGVVRKLSMDYMVKLSFDFHQNNSIY